MQETTTKFKVDISELKKSMQEAKQQAAMANAEFETVAATMDDWTKSSEGLAAKLNALEKTLKSQESILTVYEASLAETCEEYDENGKKIESLKAKLQELASKGISKASEEYAQLSSDLATQTKTLAAYERQLANQRKSYDANSKKVEQLKAKLQQLANDGVAETSDEYKKYQSELAKAEKAQARNQSKISELNAKIVTQKEVVSKAQAAYDSYAKELDSTEKEYSELTAKQDAAKKSIDDLSLKVQNQKTDIAQTKKEISDYSDEADKLSKSVDTTKDSVKKAGEGFTVFKGIVADLVASTVKTAITELKKLGAAAKDAYLEFDEGADNIIKATGATGEAAKQLENSYAEVSKRVVGDLGNIGSALGEVNTRFGFTGSELEDATTAFLKFADITGTDAVSAVQLVSRAMGDAGIKSSDYASVLDELAAAAQASGISVDKLTELLTKYGAPMRALGFETKDAIAVFSQWEKAGVNTEIAFSGMKNAISKWSSEGKDAKVEFSKTLKEIAAAPDIAKATTKAIEVFGKKAGPDLADAIKGGRFEYSEFLKIVENSEGTVDKTFDQTQDSADRVKLALQGMKVSLGQTVSEIADKYGPSIEKAIGRVTPVIQSVIGYAVDKIPKVISFISTGIEKVKPVVLALSKLIIAAAKSAWSVLQPILSVLWKALNAILPYLESGINWIIKHLPIIKAILVPLLAAFVSYVAVTKTLAAAQKAAAIAQGLLNAAMKANPIGLVVAAITALVAAFVYLWSNCEAFREFLINLWNKIKDVAGAVWDAITLIFSAAWSAIKAVWNKAAEFFQGIWDGIKKVFNAVVTFFSNIFSGAWEAIKAVWNAVADFFAAIWDGIKAPFVAAAEWFGGVFDDVVDAIKKPFNGLVQWFKDLWDEIKAVFTGTATDSLMKDLEAKGIKIEAPQLAKGGVLRRGQIGILEGNGAEAVVPLENNKKWISKTAADLKRGMQNEGIIGGAAGSAGSVTNNYNFTQNNTSPKALSRLDIYRQSKNLLRMKAVT